jgi:outer membrane protein TolC
MRRQPYHTCVPLAAALAMFLVAPSATGRQPADSSSNEPRYLTLDQAEGQASRAITPLHRLGELSVEAAKQHRLGVQADYFPKIGATFSNIHFNKIMGDTIAIQRPLLGTTFTAGVPLLGKDQTFTAVIAAQPITPLFKVRQAVNLARADERIARAKAGMSIAAASGPVKETYFALLVAQRQEALARSNLRKADNGPTIASLTPIAVNLEKSQIDAIEARKDLAEASNKVTELTASLNELLGWAPGTRLLLEAPSPLVENLSFQEVSDRVVTASPDVVEAEQNVAKARAASKLSKLEYVPDVVAMWGYAYNDNLIPLLPRDFSFVGVMASYNLFDFGKREHTVKERNAQLRMAEAALELAKMKAAAGIKQSYLELVRSRQLCEIARQAQSTIQALAVKYNPDDPDLKAASAKLEIELLQADLEHRQAYAKVKSLIGDNPERR